MAAKTTAQGVQVAPRKPFMANALPQVPDEPLANLSWKFAGEWLPTLDPSEIGPDNFSVLSNMRYRGIGELAGIEGVKGYTAINTAPPNNLEAIAAEYTETDVAADRVALTTNGVTVTALVNQELVWVYKDFTAGYFAGDFEHRVHLKCTSAGDGDGCLIWGMANAANLPLPNLITLNNAGLGILAIGDGAAHVGLSFIGRGSAWASTLDLDVGTDYYIKVRRDESVGAYGTLYVTIYTDSAYSVLHTGVSAYTSTLTTSKYDFRYLFAQSSYNNPAVTSWSGTITDLRLCAYSLNDIFQFHKDDPYEDHILVHGTIETAKKGIWDITTAPPYAGEFTAGMLHEDAAGACDPRFSAGPRGSVWYCNGKETCMWRGNEAIVDGFFQVDIPSVTRTDIALNDNGASDDTIVSVAGDFYAAGFRAGMVFSISGATTAGNNKTTYVKALSVDGLTITIPTGTLAGTDAAGASVTIAADRKHLVNPIDHTARVQNDLQDEDNVSNLGDGIDSNAKLVLHCDGSEGSTTFTDSSSAAHAVTASGNAKIARTCKFGSGSGYFDGTGDYLATTDDDGVSDYWNLGAGTFCFDFWFMATSLSATPVGLFQQRDSDVEKVQCILTSTYIMLMGQSTAGGYGLTILGYHAPAAGFSINKWYHVAVIRGWGGDANAWRICVDGDSGTYTVSSAVTLPDLAAGLEIGRYTLNGGSFSYFTGYIDEFRVSIGVPRWTTDFTPANRPYSTKADKFLVLSTVPLDGARLYLNGFNTVASTLSGWFWDGRAFNALTLTDGTTVGGVSMAATGNVSWADTYGTAKPFSFNGTYVYAYLFQLSAGSVGIYRVTMASNINPAVDVWDGVRRGCISFQVYKAVTGTYEDYTYDVNVQSDATSPVAAQLKSLGTTDWVEMMCEERAAGVVLNMIAGNVNTNTSALTVYYWNGSGWTATSGLIDGTIAERSFITSGKSGLVTWDAPEDGEEVPVNKFGVSGYIYKLAVSAAFPATNVYVDYVQFMPAQKSIGPHDFPSMFGGRALLFQGNRMDFSSPNTTNVFNGDLSSDDGNQSLYFGGSEDCKAAMSIYNRYGSNIIEALAVCKLTETYLLSGTGPEDYIINLISPTLGCVSHRTMASAEVGYLMAEGVERNILLWLSARGPVIFDGTVLKPIPGVEKYFDQDDTSGINQIYLSTACGWYDAARGEYNLAIPSGSGQTSNNLWLVYDLVRRRWFQKSPHQYYPQCGTPVVDSWGTRHVYAGINTGVVLRLEYGATWIGQPIYHAWETGDFFPTNDPWWKTLIRRVKAWGKTSGTAFDLLIGHLADTDSALPYETQTDFQFQNNVGGEFVTTVAGNFNTSGFLVGLYIQVRGTTSNDNVFLITSVATNGKTMYLSGDSAVVNETPGVSVTITQYDWKVAMATGPDRVTRGTRNSNKPGWAHRLRFAAKTSTTGKLLAPLGWGVQAEKLREDL